MPKKALGCLGTYFFAHFRLLSWLAWHHLARLRMDSGWHCIPLPRYDVPPKGLPTAPKCTHGHRCLGQWAPWTRGVVDYILNNTFFSFLDHFSTSPDPITFFARTFLGPISYVQFAILLVFSSVVLLLLFNMFLRIEVHDNR